MSIADDLRALQRAVTEDRTIEAAALAYKVQGNLSQSRQIWLKVIQYHPIWFLPIRGYQCKLAPGRIKQHFEPIITQSDSEFIQFYQPLLDQFDERYINEPKLSDPKYRMLWVIEQSRQAVGLTELTQINWSQRRCELLVGLFNQRANSKLAVTSALMALDVAFGTLKLDKVMSYVLETNHKAIRSTMALGFDHEGTLKEHLLLKNGKRVNLWQFGLLKGDYYQNARLNRLKSHLLSDNFINDPFPGLNAAGAAPD